MLLCFYAFYIIVIAVSRYVYVKINKTVVITAEENEENGKNESRRRGNKKADASEKHLQETASQSIEEEKEEKEPGASRQLTKEKVRLTCKSISSPFPFSLSRIKSFFIF